MLINFLGRMRWKLWLTVFILIGIVYLLFFSKATKEYTQFFRSKLGEFLSIFQQASQGKFFEISLNVNGDSIQDFTFNLPNSTIIVSGDFISAKISDQKVSSKDGRIESISLKDFSGSVEKKGNIFKIVGTCKSFEINNLLFSSEKISSVEIEVIPSDISLFYIKAEKIIFVNSNGELKRIKGDKSDIISLNNSKLEIYNFIGSLVISAGEIKLSGMINLAKGDGFILSEG